MCLSVGRIDKASYRVGTLWNTYFRFGVGVWGGGEVATYVPVPLFPVAFQERLTYEHMPGI